MARAPLPITMPDAESLFRDRGIEFAPARRFLSRLPRRQSQIPSGKVVIELVGDMERPPHLVRAEMTILPGAEPAELASTLGPWYRLADAVSASTEVNIDYSAEHGMIVGTGGQWWAWHIANPMMERAGRTIPWEFTSTHVPLDRKDPEGTQVVFSFRRWTGKPQYLGIETETLDRLTGAW